MLIPQKIQNFFREDFFWEDFSRENFFREDFFSRKFLLNEISFDQCENVKARQDKADLRNLFRGIHFSYVSHENLFYLCHNNIKDTKDKV